MRDATPQEIAKFNKACKALNELGKAGFHLYLANDTMNLMTGPSHDESGQKQQDLIQASYSIDGAGGGDW